MGVHHDTVTVARELKADVARVFGLWSDAKALARWYLPGDDNWSSEILEHAFEVGGRLRMSFGPTGETPYFEDCLYTDIVTDERILYAGTVLSGEERLTTSMITIEFHAIDGGTRVVSTDQIAILDGKDTSEERRQGWSEVLRNLASAAEA